MTTTVDTCRHGNPDGRCASCAACAACRGECGTCPYTAEDHPTGTGPLPSLAVAPESTRALTARQIEACALVQGVLQDHRRVQNVRKCSGKGCAWRPVRPGNTSNPDDTLRRHADFNRHLAALIVTLLDTL